MVQEKEETSIISRLKEIEKELRKEKIQKERRKIPKSVLPRKAKMAMRKANRRPNFIWCLYLLKTGKAVWKAEPVDSDFTLLIGNIVHEFNPADFWKMGKHNLYIWKEIDRRPVTNKDFDVIKKQGYATDSDAILLKAVMKAVIIGAKKRISKTALIIVGLAAAGLIIWFMSSGT